MTAVMNERAMGRSLVSEELFNRLVGRIVADEGLGRDVAERIVDQALAFLSACAANTSTPLAPSESVDIGWHTFILHTHDYAEFCQRIAGRFLHHVPTDADQDAHDKAGHATLVRTVEAIKHTGLAVDPDLWQLSGAKCTQCHGGCHDDPPPPPA